MNEMNSLVNYLYRDSSNYKASPETDVIVEGELSMPDFGLALHMGEMFIPAGLELPELQSQLESYPNQHHQSGTSFWSLYRHPTSESRKLSRRPVEMNPLLLNVTIKLVVC